MKELDLYEGSEPPRADPPRQDQDWATLLWKRFPAAVRERYEPRGVLGEGGMGIVLEAHDRAMDRVVAVKGVRDPATLTAPARERLAREARIHARLAHPNILPIFDAWTDADSNPWYTMMRVASTGGAVPTLAARLAELAGRPVERRPVAALIEILMQICRAVAHAHARGIVHRDLKPDNILLGPSGEALVADWGLALELGAPEDTAGEVAGSPRYGSPEQRGLLGRPFADKRSDVFGLGAILYEMVCGGEFQPVERRIPARVPRELAQIIERATAIPRDYRFAGAAELQRALQAYLDGGLIDGFEYTRRERAAKWVRAHPLRTLGAFSLGAVVGLAVLSYLGVMKQLVEAKHNLAISHAGWAAQKKAAGLTVEASAYAAAAFDLVMQYDRRFELPEGPVWTVFASHLPPAPLIWSSQLGASCKWISFAGDGHALDALSADTWWRFDGKGPAQHWRLASEPSWNAVMDRSGTRALVSDKLGHYRLMERGRETPLHDLQLKAGPARSAFSPDGRLLAIGVENDVQLFAVDTGQLAATLKGHAAEIWVIEFDPTGRWLASSDRAGSVRLWDVATRAPVQELRHAAGPVLAMAFAPRGDALMLATPGKTLDLHAVPSLALVRRIGHDLPAQLGVAFSPDGALLAAGGNDFQVRLFAVADGAPLAELPGHERWVWALAFSPDGKRLATGDGGGVVRLWDVALARVPRAAGEDDRAAMMEFSADGQRLIAGRVTRVVEVRDASTNRVTLTTRTAEVPQAVGFNGPQQPRAVTVSGRAVTVLDPAGAAPPLVLDAGAEPALNPSHVYLPGMRVCALCADKLALLRSDRKVRVWDLERGELAADVDAGAVTALALAPGMPLLASGDAQGGVSLRELPGGRLVARVVPVAAQPHPITGLSMSSDGDALAWCDDNGQAGVLRGPAWRGPSVKAHFAPVSCVALDRSGRRMATAAGEAAYLWQVGPDAITRMPHLEQTVDYASGLAFGPEGRLLALGTRGPPSIWDVDAVLHPRARIDAITRQSPFVYDDQVGRLVPKEAAVAPPPRLAE